MHGSGTTNEKRLQTNNKLPKVHVQNDASPSHESAHKSAADLINQEKKNTNLYIIKNYSVTFIVDTFELNYIVLCYHLFSYFIFYF